MSVKFCYGCMQHKKQSPVCEHCGFDERKLNEENQLPIGTVLRDQYIVGKVLGQGGFGITYIGWDRMLDIPIAIKEYFPAGVVHRDIHQGPEVRCMVRDQEVFEKHREKFLKEARILAQLASIPEIVQVRNFFVENNTAYIVMEYVQGITLKQLLQSMGRPMTWEESLQVMGPVLRGLLKLHDKKLIHRDISPDNIMLPTAGGVKMIDFGTARTMDDSMRSRSTESVLKPGFAPMEQYNSKGNLGTWTDVYALCATFHYLLTGKVPPDAPTRIEEGEALQLLDQVNGMTAGVRKTLLEGMAIRASDRIQTIQELQQKLYDEEKTPVKSPIKPPQQEIPETVLVKNPNQENKMAEKKGRGKKIGAVVAALAAVLAIALGFGRSRSPEVRQEDTSSAKNPTVVTAAPSREEPPNVDLNVQEVTLSVWIGLEDENDRNGYVAQMKERFEKAHPEYAITWNVQYVNEGSAGPMLVQNPEAAPDVFFFANDQMGLLLEAGMLEKLGGTYLEQVRRDNSSAVLNGVTHTDGGVYGFPVSPNTWYMWYNKDVFSEEDVKSLNTMLEKGVVSFPMENSWYTSSFLFGAGGTLFGPEGNDRAAGADFSNGDCVRAAEFMIDLVNHHNFVSDINGTGVYGMCNGSVHAMFSGYWDEPQLYRALGDKLGCAVLPDFTVGGRTYQMKSFIGCKAIGVNPNASNVKAAIELAAFLASPESQLLHYERSGITPVARDCIQDPAVRSNEHVAVEILQADSHSVVQPCIPEMSAYWDPMRNFGVRIVNGSITKAIVSRELYAMMDQINGK